jgi:hypothetical protein
MIEKVQKILIVKTELIMIEKVQKILIVKTKLIMIEKVQKILIVKTKLIMIVKGFNTEQLTTSPPPPHVPPHTAQRIETGSILINYILKCF